MQGYHAYMLLWSLHGFLVFLGEDSNDERILIEEVMKTMRGETFSETSWLVEELYSEWLNPLLANKSNKLAKLMENDL